MVNCDDIHTYNIFNFQQINSLYGNKILCFGFSISLRSQFILANSYIFHHHMLLKQAQATINIKVEDEEEEKKEEKQKWYRSYIIYFFFFRHLYV